MLEQENNLPKINENEDTNKIISKLEPVKKSYIYDYNANLIYLEFTFKWYKDRVNTSCIKMKPNDFENGAGARFNIGDIVKVKNKDYEFYDRLHVIEKCPRKFENQKYFENKYEVIINHNILDDGCHRMIFREEELELYAGKLEEDSPILFLSRILNGKIKVSKEIWEDLVCGRIALNNAPSFRDIKVLNQN